VITGYATISTAVDAMKAGAYDFLPKPFTPDELRLVVTRGCERWRLRAGVASPAAARRRRPSGAFFTFLSHQLKTPLAAAKQCLDVLTFTSGAGLPRDVAGVDRSGARAARPDGVDDRRLARRWRGPSGAARRVRRRRTWPG
jgi:CheY-like chemotaxis protein